MEKTRVSIVAVLGRNTRAIGVNGGLLWWIPGDLPRFKALTMGHPVIMGRKTHESIGRPLLGRANIVVTRQRDFVDKLPTGCITTYSVELAIVTARALDKEEVFVIGGGEIYAQTLPLADRLYLTLVDDEAVGDTFFPDYSEFARVVSRESGVGSPPHEYVTLER